MVNSSVLLGSCLVLCFLVCSITPISALEIGSIENSDIQMPTKKVINHHTNKTTNKTTNNTTNKTTNNTTNKTTNNTTKHNNTTDNKPNDGLNTLLVVLAVIHIIGIALCIIFMLFIFEAPKPLSFFEYESSNFSTP